IIGGYVYRGSQAPALTGKYICGDWGSGEEIWSVDPATGDYEILATFTPGNIISFGQDHQGEVYILGQGTNVQLYMLDVPGAQVSLPQTLSATGALSDLTSLSPAPGLVPYEMVESFWSDNALKQRWMVIPNDGSHDSQAEQIQFSEDGEWDFPIGSVLIKHFELPIDDTNPTLTRRLETRFSIKSADGSFYFLTYKWRADGSDADLIEASIDETYTITTFGGTRNQTWHFPNRTECLSCHQEALGGTLGPRTRYLNRELTYPSTGISANQLVTLSHLGILDEPIFDQDVAEFMTGAAKDDLSASLEVRARSYLDLNCGYCHRPTTGNRAVFDARLSTPLEYSGYFTQQLNESIGLPEEWVIKAGDTAASVLFQRIHSVDPSIMMPPLAKGEIDEEGSALIAEWIESLNPQLTSCAPENLALGKPVTQSSLYGNDPRFVPEKAVDGVPTDGSMTHTLRDANAWWEIDLEDSYNLSGIRLFNRVGCCSDRLSNFYVFVSDQPFTSTDFNTTLNQADVKAVHYPGVARRETYLDLHTSGRYLRVQLAGTNYLTLAEVEIMGCTPPPAPTTCNTPSNIALGQTATQSSMYGGALNFEAGNAVDGNNNGVNSSNTLTHTLRDVNAWWELDLGATADINEIRLWNRTDCCSGRLSNFYVLVSDQPFASQDLNASINQAGVNAIHFPGTAGRETSFPINGQGRYVRVQ
ncbi:MAG: discoidin domain-containing protein, partial [Bacteroidota bacterium]